MTIQPTYRIAAPDDIAVCVDIRGKTRENAYSVDDLKAVGITLESWRAEVVDGSLVGYVCLDQGQIVGYCFGEKTSGEIAVVALLPAWEGKGIGKQLLEMVVRDLAATGIRRMFLSCSADPAVRSYGFYRHLGWTSSGTVDTWGDEVLEYLPTGHKLG